MPYLVELVVNEYGSLSAPESAFPVREVVDHDWCQPYPALSSIVPFTWESGESGEQPNVFWCPQIRDWVCDEPAYETLTSLAGADLGLIAQGDLDGKALFVVQVVGLVSGAVDQEESLIEDFGSYRVMQFPSFYSDQENALASRLFRIPEMYLALFAGDRIEREVSSSGLSGLSFTRTDSTAR